jgi:hypothetical protein
LKGLQAEWKAIGPVRKSKSEQVWQRFRTAADKVFDRYRNRDAQALAERVSRRETICAEIEALAARGGRLAEESGLLEKVRSLRTGWQQAGALPRDSARALSDRFDQALGAIRRGVTSDVQAHRARRGRQPAAARAAVRTGREARVTRAGGAGAASPVATLATAVARGAGGEHHRRPTSMREAAGRTASTKVRGAQDAWRQVGFVPEAAAAAADRALPARLSAVLLGQRRPTSGPPSGGDRTGRAID